MCHFNKAALQPKRNDSNLSSYVNEAKENEKLELKCINQNKQKAEEENFDGLNAIY